MFDAQDIITQPAEVTALKESFGSSLGTRLRSEFAEVEAERRDIEQEWLKDLRQYNGEYDPEVLAKIHPKRSKAFIRLTRVKVKTLDAQIYDMLFPGGGEKNYAIEATPVATIDPERHGDIIKRIALDKLSAVAEAAEQSGEPLPVPVEQFAQLIEAGNIPPMLLPDEEEVRTAVQQEAKARAERMAKVIDDQLTESRYAQHIRSVIHSGHLFGTGVLKGPMVEVTDEQAYELIGGQWVLRTVERRKPYVEAIPLWDIYPDMSVNNLADAEFIFERHVYNRQQLRKLAKRKDFRGEAILEYIKVFPHGDAQVKNWESELRAGSRDQVYKALDRRRRYEVLEYWGLVTGDEIAALGVNVPDDMLCEEVEANIWILGDIVIKAALNKTNKQWRPYYFYYFEKDETSIFGRGLPHAIRDTQTGANASIRVMQDHAAITAGPLVEVNTAVCKDPNPTELFPFKVYLTHATGIEAQYPAVRVTNLGSNTAEFMAMFRMWKELNDEVSTVPSYVHGESDKQAGRTARGLSMLMGAQRVTVKDIMENFDYGVTEPFISNLYDWNMKWNPREDIKGDFAIKARGSTALIAREVYAESLDMLAQTTKDDIDGPYIRRGELLRERVKARDVDAERFVKTDDEVAQERAAMQQQAMMLQQQAMQAAQQDKALDHQRAMELKQVGAMADIQKERIRAMGRGIPV